MVLFNHSTRELTAKIVYYGPGLCGKTTNLRVLHQKLEQGTTGRLLSLSTAQDRTIYFDLLPVELGNVKGYTVRFQLCTVPGQVFYNETRKLVLKGVDGIVFVVDSQWSMLSHNLESFQNLRENMVELGQGFEDTAVVIQYNKRDLPGVLSVQALQESLGFQEFPFVEAVAADARGVVETFKLVSKMAFVQLLKRLQRSPDGEKLGPEWVAPPSEDPLRTSRIPAVGAELLALASTVGPAPAPPTDSPFETTASWPSMPRGEVFGDATIPPRPFPSPLPVEPAVPSEAPASPDASDDTFTDVTAEETEAGPSDLAPASPELPQPAPSAATTEAGPATDEPAIPEASPTPTVPASEPAPSAAVDPAPEPPSPPPPPAPQPPPAPVVWAEAFASLSGRMDDLARARAEETSRLEALTRETREALEGRLEELHSPIDRRLDELRTSFEERAGGLRSSLEEGVGGLRASLGERAAGLETTFATRVDELKPILEARFTQAESALAARLDELKPVLEARVAQLESALAGRVDELRTSLDGRLAALEAAVARLEASDRLDEVRRETAEVKRLVESKLDEAGGQSRRLGTFLRRALEELEPPEKG